MVGLTQNMQTIYLNKKYTIIYKMALTHNTGGVMSIWNKK